MRTKIISAFPGCGKTHFFNQNKNVCLDSDSSLFSWSYNEDGTKIRNSLFPQNYIDHIKENIGKYEYIFISSHEEVRNALLDECIFFYLVYPSYEMKDMFLRRYKERGNDNSFIELVDKNWHDWLNAIWITPSNGLKKVKMTEKYLGDQLKLM